MPPKIKENEKRFKSFHDVLEVMIEKKILGFAWAVFKKEKLVNYCNVYKLKGNLRRRLKHKSFQFFILVNYDFSLSRVIIIFKNKLAENLVIVETRNLKGSLANMSR